MIDSSLYRMADRLAGGHLAGHLVAWRRSGLSLDRIAQRLAVEFGIQVTKQTVANWLAALNAQAVS